MSTLTLLVIVLVGVGLLYVLLRVVVKTYLRFHGKMVVTCPETQEAAAVEVDARHAASTAAFGELDLRLQQCTRWPEHQNCGRACLAQIEQAPENCLVQTMLSNWYRGKACVYCKKTFAEINWYDHKPALRSPDGRLVEWSDVPPETVPEVLRTHAPVCWDCLIAESFRRQHPDLVIDRPWKRNRLFH